MNVPPLSLPGAALLNRRRLLQNFTTGFAGIALAGLLDREAHAASPWRPVFSPQNPVASRIAPESPRARRLLVIHCSGGVSHLDSFDWKPELVRMHDQPMPGAKEHFVTFQGENGNLTQPLWEFRPRGASGKMISDLFPCIAQHADDLCFIHSMTAKSNTHGPAESQMTTGFTMDGFPSVGAWVSYALGAETEELPAFVAIPDSRGMPMAGVNVWGNGFLPAVFQGTAFQAAKPLRNLSAPAGIGKDEDAAAQRALRFLNQSHLQHFEGDSQLAARIASYELAARMQLAVPEVTDLGRESEATRAAYCTESADPVQQHFGRNCLLARRLLERGVRCVQLHHGCMQMGAVGAVNWDGHRDLKNQYARHAFTFDQPVASLLADLKQRGLLEDTLVVWTTEFGRMPTFQKGASGRDHNPDGFTVWLAGAGVRGGMSYGATDAFGHRAVEQVSSIYDLHATVLHLMGLDHERLSFYHNGIERRLTDVHGHVLHDILS
jgi:hypothetical protein